MIRDPLPAAAAAGARPGEGVSDPAELANLIELLRRAEGTGQARREVRVGEFLVDGVRVPVSLIPGLQLLSRSEAAAVRLVGWGRSNADIGLMLNMHESTVRSHLSGAIAKLGVDGMRQLNSLAGLLFHPLD